MIAEVIVDLPVLTGEFGFDYIVPPYLETEIAVGDEVDVTFNRRHVKGIVARLKGDSVYADPSAITCLTRHDTFLCSRSMELAEWITRRYLCPSMDALRLFYPSYIEDAVQKQTVLLAGPSGATPDRLTVLQQKLYDLILANPFRFSRAECNRLCGVSSSVMDALVKKGAVQFITSDEAYVSLRLNNDIPERLTDEQQSVLDTFEALRLQGDIRPALLHGVTGSGKTEVYIRMVEKTLACGRQAIITVPEIGLTPQISGIFRSRFGQRLAVLHSAMSAGERASEWRRIAGGDADIVLGPRSAVFAPLRDPGIIVIDEEHDQSYKQENCPRYHARDVAVKRAEIYGAHVVLGSATPSLESYHKASNGCYVLLELKKRVADRELPGVEIIDMREELKSGNRRVFSLGLMQAVREALDDDKQSILFLNRRGYSTFVLCRGCGYSVQCPNCSVSLTYHLKSRTLTCHHCDYKGKAPETCPKCASHYIRYFGLGTEKLEESAASEFPDAAIFRMDRDTTSRKGAHQELIEAFRNKRGGILIGTQMVTKGHDFPDVTVVGVIAADISLNVESFRAGEKTFQLLTQVAGRAGRGSAAGKVLLQTYNPEHPAVLCAAGHDYATFYAAELLQREELSYPPFSHIINIVSSDQSQSAAGDRIASFADLLRREMPEDDIIIGPAPAAIARLKGHYRWHLLLKSMQLETTLKHLRQVLLAMRQSDRKGLVVDVDSESML
ncbi:MAG: primosomal protein N' [bacterium]|nr:primosomal protein N' [bacterium]